MKNEISENDLELLSAWLDGECGDPAALRARLSAEPELAQRLRQLQGVRARMASLPSPNPPADFAERVTARAFARKLRVPTRRFWWTSLSVAAAAMLVVMAGQFRTVPRHEMVAPDSETWRTALNSLAESPDAEAMAEWVGVEPVLDETLPNDLVGALADLSSGEPGGGESAEIGEPETNASLIDMMDQMNIEDAAAMAAMLKSGA